MSSENSPSVETIHTTCTSSHETHGVNSPVPPISSLATSSNIPPVMTWNSYIGLSSIVPQTLCVNTVVDGQSRSVQAQVVPRNYPTGYHTSTPVYGGSTLETPVTVSMVRQNADPSSIQQTLDVEPVQHGIELRQTMDEAVRHTPPPHHAPGHPNVTMIDPSTVSTIIDTTTLHTAASVRPLTSISMSLSERLSAPIQHDADVIMTASLDSSKLEEPHGAIAAMPSIPDRTVVHNLQIQDTAGHHIMIQPPQPVAAYSVVSQSPVLETMTTHDVNTQHHQIHQDVHDVVTLPLMTQPQHHLQRQQQQQFDDSPMAARSSRAGQNEDEPDRAPKRGRPLGGGKTTKKNAPRSTARKIASKAQSMITESFSVSKDDHMDLAEVLKNVSMVPNPSKVSSPRKLKRKAYSIREKLKTVERVKTGEPRSKILRDMGIPDSTLRGWMKDEEKLRTFGFNVDTKKKKARTAKDTLLDSVLFSWYLQQKDRGLNVSGSMLKLKADELNKDINGENNFKASAGWLYRFQKRHNLGKQKDEEEEYKFAKPSVSEVYRDDMLHFPYDQTARSQVSASTDENVVHFCQKLKDLVIAGGYQEEQIYTCDETGFFYKLLPDNNLLVPSDEPSCANSKRIRDRITILFCANKTGQHKLKPLSVGKYRSPRGFQHVNVVKLPFWYKCSHNAWMTTTIFKDWFVTCFVPEVRQYLRDVKLEEKALLLLDESAAHPAGDVLSTPDRSIQVLFLPKETTSVVQPLDQGIMATFKTNYRNELIQEVISTETEVKLFLRHLSLKRMMYIGDRAWASIKPKSIERAWHKSFPGVFSGVEQIDGPSSPSVSDAIARSRGEAEKSFQLKLELSGIETSLNTIREWANLNENLPIADSGSNEDATLIQQREDPPEPMEQEPSDDDEENHTKVPSNTEAVNAFEIGLQWLESKNIDYITILQVQSILDYARYERRNELSQLNSC